MAKKNRKIKRVVIGNATLYLGDCTEVMAGLKAERYDSMCSDPPYAINFMAKGWDSFDGKNQPGKNKTHKSNRAFQAWCELWAAQSIRVLKHGAHTLTFGGTRTYHRMACGIEDAGFEIRDQLAWVYGSGWPKSLNIRKAIDAQILTGKTNSKGIKAANAARPGEGRIRATNQSNGLIKNKETGARVIKDQSATVEGDAWHGWGTALKPAWEPICLARKPLAGTVAANVIKHSTGALNIDKSRVGTFVNTTPSGQDRYNQKNFEQGYRPNAYTKGQKKAEAKQSIGRWPANLVHDGSEEVLHLFPSTKSGKPGVMRKGVNTGTALGKESRKPGTPMTGIGDEGSAARFFYQAKVSPKERSFGMGEGSKNDHPTLKPIALCSWLINMITPPGGRVLDPFMGSGSMGIAAIQNGFKYVGIEKDPAYFEIACKRLQAAHDAINIIQPIRARVDRRPAVKKTPKSAKGKKNVRTKNHKKAA